MTILKSHEFATLVNELRDTARQFHGTQQLRERVSEVLQKALLNLKNPPSDFEEFMTSQYGDQYARGAFPAEAMRKCWDAAQASSRYHQDLESTEQGSWVDRASAATDTMLSGLREIHTALHPQDTRAPNTSATRARGDDVRNITTQ